LAIFFSANRSRVHISHDTSGCSTKSPTALAIKHAINLVGRPDQSVMREARARMPTALNKAQKGIKIM